jgi:hypothetical protein
MSKASIIIPAFNQGRFLAQAIQSALRQTQREVEVVVIDDGSTDDTPAVAAPFLSYSNFKYLRQANTGLPGARNRGLRESSGDYVCFLDSDDFLHAEKIQRQAGMLDADPQLGFVYCDIVTVDESGQPVAEAYSVGAVGRPLSGNIFSSLMLGGYFPPHTVLMRRSVLESVGGFDPELGGHADYDLWLRVSAAGHRACYQDEKLAFYRAYPGSMSKDGQHMAETRAATFRKICRSHPDLVGEALHGLQTANHDLFKANQWLSRQWDGVLQNVISSAAPGNEARQQFSLLAHFADAKLVRGKPDQAAIWDATVDGVSSKSIYLHASAEMVFTIPTGAKGQFATAVGLHPDAWTKPGGGGCEFHLRIDGRAACVVALDPVHLPADRHWHEINLDVPESATGTHTLTLETRAIGPSADFRWALWREPKFSWPKAVSLEVVPTAHIPSATAA